MIAEPEIRAVLGTPSALVAGKQLDHLDPHARAFVEAAPMVMVATASADGGCDCSPRGDGPGFVAVLDDRTLLIPERKGNRRADTLVNVAQTGQIGLLFLVPGVTETLRVNGAAEVIEDAVLLAPLESRGRVPELGLRVTAEEVFFHCARAFLRSQLWTPEAWPARPIPSLGKVLADQAEPGRIDADALDEYLVEDARDLG